MGISSSSTTTTSALSSIAGAWTQTSCWSSCSTRDGCRPASGCRGITILRRFRAPLAASRSMPSRSHRPAARKFRGRVRQCEPSGNRCEDRRHSPRRHCQPIDHLEWELQPDARVGAVRLVTACGFSCEALPRCTVEQRTCPDLHSKARLLSMKFVEPALPSA